MSLPVVAFDLFESRAVVVVEDRGDRVLIAPLESLAPDASLVKRAQRLVNASDLHRFDPVELGIIRGLLARNLVADVQRYIQDQMGVA